MNNFILLGISAIIFVAYVAYIWIKYGIQKSISMSVYCLSTTERWIFTLVLFGFTIPIMIVASDKVWMPIAAWLVSGVGAVWNILSSKITKGVHLFAAISGIITANYSLITEYHMWLLPALLALMIAITPFAFNKKYFIWYIEIESFAVILLGLFANELIKL